MVATTSENETSGPKRQAEVTADSSADALRRRRRAGAVVALLAIGGLAAWIVSVGVRERGLRVWTLLDDASGMQADNPVTLAGVRVGAIEEIALTDDHRVRLTVRIDPAHARRLRAAPVARDDACAGSPGAEGCGSAFVSGFVPTLTSLTAPRTLMLRPGTGGRPIADGDYLPSVQSAGLEPLLETLQDEEVVRDLPRALVRLLPAMARTLHSTDDLTRGLRRSPLRGLLGTDEPEKPDEADKADRSDKPDRSSQPGRSDTRRNTDQGADAEGDRPEGRRGRDAGEGGRDGRGGRSILDKIVPDAR